WLGRRSDTSPPRSRLRKFRTGPVFDIGSSCCLRGPDDDLPLLEVRKDVACSPDIDIEKVLKRAVGDPAVLVEMSEDLAVDLIDCPSVVAHRRTERFEGLGS